MTPCIWHCMSTRSFCSGRRDRACSSELRRSIGEMFSVKSETTGGADVVSSTVELETTGGTVAVSVDVIFAGLRLR